VVIKEDRMAYYLLNGARVSPTVKTLCKNLGIAVPSTACQKKNTHSIKKKKD
jgi:ribosomal protein S16